jgi:hypothetical protein
MERFGNLPIMTRDALVVERAVDGENKTLQVLWTTGATVRRRKYSFWDDDVEEYDEELVVNDKSVRLDALNARAPFLDSHSQYGLDSVIGRVEPGTATIRGGKGYATIKLSRAARHADTVVDLMDGIVSNISCGYRIHKVEEVQRKDQVLLRRVIDWEPLEISAVAIGADPDSKTLGRSASKDERVFRCAVFRDGHAFNATRARMLMRQRQSGFGG